MIVILGAAIFIGRTAPLEQQSQPGKIQVAASFYPLYFFASQIGGDKATVINITPAGAEPHDYEPTAQDIVQIENSRLLILNGNVEPWGDSIKQNIDPNKTTIVVAGEGLTTQKVEESGQSVIDPHVWLSPPLAKEMVDKITQAFIGIDPSNSAYYQSNANALKSQLDGIDAAYREGLKDCKSKDIITSHAAFGYLAAHYGLVQVPIAGLSPDAEPSPQQLAQIVTFAKQNNIKYIFFESLVSPKLSDTIANEIGAKTLVLNPIEGLTNDELAQGKNYITEMQSNLATLETALQCNK